MHHGLHPENGAAALLKPSRGRTYDREGRNRDTLLVDDDDVASPANGCLWNLAQRADVSFRNYGEFVIPLPADARADLALGRIVEALTRSPFWKNTVVFVFEFSRSR